MDAYVKTVLTVIAACLLLQVAQGFGLAGTPGLGPEASCSPERAERYRLQPIPIARALVRLDVATGRTWTMPLQPDKEKLWTPVDEIPSQPTAREEGEDAAPRPDAAGE